jgi:hypothetical protein
MAKEKEHLNKRWIKELLSDIELFRYRALF